jgi:hypothetical protein
MRVEGLGELREIMKKLGSLEPVKTGLKAGAAELKREVAKEPPVSRRPQAQFWSDKQRRGFFAKLRSGEIEVPYYRGINRKSERLRQSWTVQSRHGGLTWIIGNDASYGPMVKSPVEQITYHKKTGWKDTDQDVVKMKPKINHIVKQVVDRALEGR